MTITDNNVDAAFTMVIIDGPNVEHIDTRAYNYSITKEIQTKDINGVQKHFGITTITIAEYLRGVN